MIAPIRSAVGAVSPPLTPEGPPPESSPTRPPTIRTLNALDRLEKEGKVPAIGLSNVSLAQLEEARTLPGRSEGAAESVLELRPLVPADFPAFRERMARAYADLGGLAAEPDELELLLALYPGAQRSLYCDGVLVGGLLSRVVPYAEYACPHLQADLLDTTRYAGDDARGEALYGLDVFVDPACQGRGWGAFLIRFWVDLLRRDNLRALIGASRVPGYAAVYGTISLEDYARSVARGERRDPVLSVHLAAGHHLVCAAPDYDPHDRASLGQGYVVALPNPSFDPRRPVAPGRTNPQV